MLLGKMENNYYNYDGNGNVILERNYKNIITRRTFDAHNRMLTEVFSGDTTKYTYDEKNLRSVTVRALSGA